jgi:hypothetical protein
MLIFTAEAPRSVAPGEVVLLGGPEISGAIFALDALEAEPDWSDLAA